MQESGLERPVERPGECCKNAARWVERCIVHNNHAGGLKEQQSPWPGQTLPQSSIQDIYIWDRMIASAVFSTIMTHPACLCEKKKPLLPLLP